MRARADEARIIAERMHFAPAKRTMFRLAATFDRLADRLATSPTIERKDSYP
jgi:hypothetical protein